MLKIYTFLVIFLCTVVNAQSQEKAPVPQNTLPEGTVLLPLVTLCSPLEPDLGLYQRYGEIAFVDGDATFYIPGNKTVNGKLTIYMKPGFDANTFTIIFQVGTLYCMIASGKNMVPADSTGDPT